jgi:hypothetical protein
LGEDRAPLPAGVGLEAADRAQYGPGAGVRIWLPLDSDVATVELPDRIDASPHTLDRLRSAFPDAVELVVSDRPVFAPEAPRRNSKPKPARGPRPR